MAEDAGRLLVRIEATQAKFEKQMAAIAKSGAASAKSVENNFKKANDNIARGSPQAAAAIGKSTQAASQLSFQLNDIATSLAGGASPFQVMMQQGSQVTQVFNQMGGGIKGVGRVIGGALGSMLNPVSLLTFGFIFLAGKALEYFTSVDEGSKDSEKALKKEQDLIDGVVQKWGDLLPTLKEIIDARKTLAEQSDIRAATEVEAAKAYRDVDAEIKALIPDIQEVRKELHEINTAEADAAIKALMLAMGNLLKENEAGTASVEDINAVINTFAGILKNSANPQVQKLIKGLNETKPAMEEASGAAKQLRDEAEKAAEMQKIFNKALADMRDIAKGHLSDAEKLIELYNTAIAAMGTLDDKQRELMERRMLPGFLDAQQATVLSGSAADVIRKEEGFRANPYPDPDDLAIGFGMHQYIDDAGRVIDITSDMKTTMLEANEQLARQIPRYQAEVIKAIGSEQWAALEEGQQAALTSIAWNYGHLPSTVAAAIKAGDHGQAAVAIANLTSNPERRKREAQLYAGGSYAAGDAMKAADAYKTARENLTEYLATLDEQASLQQRINDINASGLSPDEKTTAIAVETELQKALNQAKRDGITLSERDIALIREKAVANAAADISADKIKDAAKLQADALKDAQRAAEDFQRSVQSAVGGLIKDLIAGKDAAESFANALQKIADKAIDMAIQNMFSMGGPGATGGLLGGMIIPGILHKGGVAGADGYGSGRAVPASMFAGAKRYHKGGLVGGEVPAILKRGEIVLPAGAARKGSGSNDTVNLRLHDDSGRMAEIADQRIQTASGTIIKVSVVQSAKTVQRQLPGMMANAQVRNG